MSEIKLPVTMVHTTLGTEVEAETALAFNNLAVNGYKVKNGNKKTSSSTSAPKPDANPAPASTVTPK